MDTRYVLAAIHFDSISGRDFLSGMFAYTEPGYRWRFKILQTDDEMSADVVRNAVADGADGFILTFLGDEGMQRELQKCGKPVVTLAPKRNLKRLKDIPLTIIKNDNTAIGRLGGEFLSSLGSFASYGFVHSKPGFNFSEDRCAAFSSFLRKKKIGDIREFWPNGAEGNDADITGLAAWLGDLPKPSAVMAACDRRAIDVLSVAERMGIKVPENVSLIGVDNDELLAEKAWRPLTSILPGHFEMGLAAARELGRLMTGGKVRGVDTICIPPKTVIVRESTAPLAPATALVARARKFIAGRATKGISTMDVVRHLGCSRNLADLRYRELEGITIHAAIEKTRLAAVKRLVETTDRTVTAIAAQCGFKSPNRLTHLFRQRFGCSIREWRRA